MKDKDLMLFGDSDKPDVKIAWDLFEDGLRFTESFGLDKIVKGNEDFYVGPIEFEVTYISKDEVNPWSDAAKFMEDIVVIEIKNNYPMECWQ